MGATDHGCAPAADYHQRIERTLRIAAIQLEPRIGDVAENLERCRQLGDEAAAAGARWIVLPEFFSTGMGFREELADAALAPDGAATELLRDLARRHDATVGGSFLCRDSDGHVRNAWLTAMPDGEIAGRHDKDLPTMWENCFYVGGEDDGVHSADGLDVGVALCWEFMRTQTPRRLRGRVDLVVGGSCWWSIPPWPPAAATRRLEHRNARTAALAPIVFGRYVGAPVAHAAHCGPVACRLPWTPFGYEGIYQGGAVVADAAGNVLARRDRRDGPGIAVAEVAVGRTAALDDVPDRFWLHRRGAIAAALWNVQRAHGRRWYPRHVAGRPPLRVPTPKPAEEIPA